MIRYILAKIFHIQINENNPYIYTRRVHPGDVDVPTFKELNHKTMKKELKKQKEEKVWKNEYVNLFQ